MAKCFALLRLRVLKGCLKHKGAALGRRKRDETWRRRLIQEGLEGSLAQARSTTPEELLINCLTRTSLFPKIL
jgi:hypothetical protein